MENGELRILMVEDVQTDAELEVRELRRAGLRVAHRIVETEQAFREALKEFRPELIISDFSMPHFDGMWALALARELAPEVPFVFVSGTIGEEYAIRALKNGATDYVLKNNLVRLPAAVERSLEDAKARALRVKMERELHESHERFQALLETAPDAIVLANGAGNMILANAEMERVFGYRREELLGKSVDMLVPDVQRPAHATHRASYLASPRTRRMAAKAELQGRRKDGTLIPVEISLSPVVFNDETHVIGIVRDVTERREQELKIARLSRIHAVLSGINAVIVRIRDRQKLLEEACRIAVEHGGFGMAWIGMLDQKTLAIVPIATAGVETESFIAKSPNTASLDSPLGRGIVGRAVREKRAVFSNDMAAEPSQGGARRKEALRRGYRSLISLPLVVENEAVGSLSLFAKEPNFFDDEEIKLLTELAGDISFALEHMAKEEKLTYLAYYDQLTGLPNRSLFLDRVNQALQAEQESGGQAALLIMDLQRFGIINDTYGRQTGDALLKLIAERLENVLMSREWLARIGADSFAMVLRDVKHAADVAHALEEGLLKCVKQPSPLGGEALRMSAQAGIALFPADGADAESLLRNAEAALKKAKEAGEEYLFYAPQMNARVAEQMKLENDLRNALLQEQYVLHYQPKFELASGKMVGMEALIRWQHPERGMVSPGEFVPLLEETGMILEVGRWALKRAALEHAAWCAKGLQPPRIAVNVSPVQLRRKDFVEYVREALATVEKSGERIDIEITESMLMEDIEGSIAKLKAIRELGISVAVDDFGTGYSSLSYLARLPITSLKIDRSFVIQMPKSPEQMAIVSTVISLARALNLRVVAEGVETEEQANLLRLLRCDEVQGYLFGRPVPPGDIEKLLKAA